MFSCGCCGADTAEALLVAPDSLGQPVTIAHCTICCALTPIYQSSKKTHVDQQCEWGDAPWSKESEEELKNHAQTMKGLLSFYRKYLPSQGQKLKVYDIGAGRGNLIASLIEEGYDASACEPSVILSSRARNIYGLTENQLVTASADDFLDAKVAEAGSVKTVFLWHVLEHMTEPVKLLKRIREILSEDGSIICQGPLLHPAYVYPEHFFLHTESNISWLAEAAGLKLLMEECQAPERFSSFVMAHPNHPEPACPQVRLNDSLLAVGSLYFTLSQSLARLSARLAANPPLST